jgi:SAM-dependent methyltransferase
MNRSRNRHLLLSPFFMADHTQRFSSRVDYYVRSRPKYPGALLRFFQSDLALSPIDPVADIGAGTGLLTELFIHNGNPTFAVEPNDPMRAAAETRLGEWANFHSVKGTAEATTLPTTSVKFVVAGQAFHWFDIDKSRVEFCRILTPDGIVALVWNDRPEQGSPFNQHYERLIATHQIEPKEQMHRLASSRDDIPFKKFFGPGGYQLRTFDNPQTLDRQGLIDRVASASYMPLPDHPSHPEMQKELEQLFEKHQQNGFVQIPLITKVYFGRVTHSADH